MRAARAVPVHVRERLRAALPQPLWRLVRDAAVGQTAVQRRLRSRSLRVRRRQLAPPGDAWVGVWARGEPWVARRVEAVDPEAVRRDTLGLVTGALDGGGVAHLVLPDPDGLRHRVVVRLPDRERALESLRAAVRHDVVHVGAPRGDGVRDVRALPRARHLGTPTVLRVFRVLAGPDGGYLVGPELGVDLEFWEVAAADGRTRGEEGEPVAVGALVAPRPNPWALVIREEDQQPVHALVDGAERPVPRIASGPHEEGIHFPVDVVYTWVDGSDPRWRARRAAALAEDRVPGLHDLAANEGRYTSRDELRYSLRSLELNADWVRHVHLVTDDQVPEWLDPSHPRLSVVSHRDLFGDRGRLPTFNSHAIETQLHHLPGLAEHYLYLNDDVFLGRPVAPSLFFLPGGATRFHLSTATVDPGPLRPDDTPVTAAAKQGRGLIREAFGVTLTRRFQHVPHALRRSVMTELDERFPSALADTAASRFRSPRDVSVSASLAHHYAYLTGRAVPGSLAYFYADLAWEDTEARLAAVLAERRHDVLCLNDHDPLDPEASARRAEMVQSFLARYFPVPSSFERPRGPQQRSAHSSHAG